MEQKHPFIYERNRPKRIENTDLVGLKEISDYLRMSESKLQKILKNKKLKFPAEKIDGLWMSDKLSIDKWRRELLNNNISKTIEY